MTQIVPALPWLEPGDPFPPSSSAWTQATVAPGLLCAGADLSVDTLVRAYQRGIFPWFSREQPILWWSPDPRLVLQVADFRLHASLKKTLRAFIRNPACEIRVDSAFEQVMWSCANAARPGQSHGSWIVPDMVRAYLALHHAGLAHSIECWIDGQLVGGLYCVALGHAVFGESMFFRVPNASKIALAALVCVCRHHHIPQIDCQQATRHLQSLGAREMSRDIFSARLLALSREPAVTWGFAPLYWRELLSLPGAT